MVSEMTPSPSEPRKTRKEVISEWRHHEVLEAACRIFARQGYGNTNVEDIAKEAGIAKGTIYLYFKSKEEVLAAVLVRDLEALTQQSIDAMSKVDTFAAQLEVFLSTRGAYIRNNEDFLRVFFAEFGGRGSKPTCVTQAVDKLYRQGVEFMSKCLEQAIARGEVRPLAAEAAAFAIHDLARGFGERHLRGSSVLSLEEDLAFAHSLIMNGLK